MTVLKTILATAILTISNSVFANPECFVGKKYLHPMCRSAVANVIHHHHRHNDWVAPAIIIGGVVVAAEIARQNEILREHDRINRIPPSRTVIIERSPVCTEWREVYENGRYYKERTCSR